MPNVTLTSTRNRSFTNKDVEDAVSKAIDQINVDFKNVDTVIIKPNLCYYWDYSTGQTTDPRVVSAVIDYVRARTRKDVKVLIAEADASAMRTKYAFKMLGYERLSQQKNAHLVNLSEGEIVNKEVSVGKEKFTLEVNKILLEGDVVINVPKLKYQRVAGVSCALKNMFGAISTPRKFVYHQNKKLFQVIVGMNKIVKSHITVADGIIALGKYPKKMGVVIAGDNALSTDFVAARILGYNPLRVGYLRLSREEFGPFKINLIEDGVKISQVERNFPKQDYVRQKISWQLQLSMLKTYAKLVGDVIPPILDES